MREGGEVKLLPREGELYVLAQSRDRVCKERAMRRRQLKKLWKRLKELQAMEVKRDQLLIKLGQAKSGSPMGWRLVEVEVSREGKLSFSLRRKKLREARHREGRYLLRSNLCDENPDTLWCGSCRITLCHRLRQHAPGLTPRAVLEKLATIQMLDACFPTTDGRWLIFARYTQPEKDHRMLTNLLDMQLPPQRPPRITHDRKKIDS